jgi:hypothetical protein
MKVVTIMGVTRVKGGKWCCCPGQQSPMDGKMGEKMNILQRKKFGFYVLKNVKFMEQNKGKFNR